MEQAALAISPAAEAKSPSQPKARPQEGGGAREETPWRCSLINPPPQILMGQKLNIRCEGEEAKKPFQDSLSIIFPEGSPPPPWLYIVKMGPQTPFSVQFEAVPWRTGHFSNIPFRLSDGQISLEAGGLSFHTQSVLKEGASPHPPFGPWREALPKGFALSLGAAAALMALALALMLRSALKRRRFIRSIDQRRGKQAPSLKLIHSLRGKHPLTLAELERRLQTFLEESFFIPALEKDPSDFLKEAKKYHKEKALLLLAKKAAALLQEIKDCQSQGLQSAALELKESAIHLALEAEDLIKSKRG